MFGRDRSPQRQGLPSNHFDSCCGDSSMSPCVQCANTPTWPEPASFAHAYNAPRQFSPFPSVPSLAAASWEAHGRGHTSPPPVPNPTRAKQTPACPGTSYGTAAPTSGVRVASGDTVRPHCPTADRSAGVDARPYLAATAMRAGFSSCAAPGEETASAAPAPLLEGGRFREEVARETGHERRVSALGPECELGVDADVRFAWQLAIRPSHALLPSARLSEPRSQRPHRTMRKAYLSLGNGAGELTTASAVPDLKEGDGEDSTLSPATARHLARAQHVARSPSPSKLSSSNGAERSSRALDSSPNAAARMARPTAVPRRTAATARRPGAAPVHRPTQASRAKSACMRHDGSNATAARRPSPSAGPSRRPPSIPAERRIHMEIVTSAEFREINASRDEMRPLSLSILVDTDDGRGADGRAGH
eukprot:4662514-Pleurochrysis_carterae.AAC.1